MAQIKSAGSVVVELSMAELEVVRRALVLVDNFGPVADMDPARELLGDLANLEGH